MSTRPRSRSCRALALALVGVCVVACSSSKGAPELPSDGPLVISHAPGGLCAPAGRAGEVTLGADVLSWAEDAGGADVRVESVELVDPVNLRIIESSLVEILETNLIGDRPYYPPNAKDVARSGIDWANRVAAPGGVIPADREVTNLLLGIAVLERGIGTAQAIRVTYSVEGDDTTYQTQNQTTLEFPWNGKNCLEQ